MKRMISIVMVLVLVTGVFAETTPKTDGGFNWVTYSEKTQTVITVQPAIYDTYVNIGQNLLLTLKLLEAKGGATLTTGEVNATEDLYKPEAASVIGYFYFKELNADGTVNVRAVFAQASENFKSKNPIVLKKDKKFYEIWK